MSLEKQLNSDLQRVPKSGCAPNNLSMYCDYNDAFTDYDQVRQPHGLRKLSQIFNRSNVPIQKQIVLEGGFGTGAYLGIFSHKVQEIYGVEGSDEGYRQTQQKIGTAKNIHLRRGTILQLPFSDNFFHAYMVNQVLHHLDSGPPFPQLDTFLSEAHRVLMPGGQVTINTCSQEQLNPDQGVYWHFKYIPGAACSMQMHYISIEELVGRLESAGFRGINLTIPSEKIFQQRYYEDPLIALEPDFRKGDSTYSFLSPEEIGESKVRLRTAIDDGSVYKEMERTAACAAEIGEAVIISARKGS